MLLLLPKIRGRGRDLSEAGLYKLSADFELINIRLLLLLIPWLPFTFVWLLGRMNMLGLSLPECEFLF